MICRTGPYAIQHHMLDMSRQLLFKLCVFAIQLGQFSAAQVSLSLPVQLGA